MTDASSALVRRLAGAIGARVLETHISWVLLAGEFAYKLKKPVRLPFVDYSTLERRRHFCEEELRLNRRLAPGLYLGLSRVTGPPEQPSIDGAGPLLEYAVRMRRFPDGALFSEQLAAGKLQPAAVDRLAERLAAAHASASNAVTEAGGTSPSQRDRTLAAFRGCVSLLHAHEESELLAWIEAQSRLLQPLWTERRARGCVRECHGDLHLANIVSLQDDVAAFDCIEFDADLRWIDILDDAAFAFMDFLARGRRDLGWRFLNAWLERTGDYDAVTLLPFSVVQHALVRAQVENLRDPASAAARRYARLAVAWSRPLAPHLAITHGLPGSGKTFASQQLLEQQGAVRVRSDVERKRLSGMGTLDDSRAKGVEIYTDSATRRTYARLFEVARTALKAGVPVVIDAAFLRLEERRQAHELARQLQVPFSIIACKAPLPLLRERLLARKGDASEADAAVLEKLRRLAEPLAPEERPFLSPRGEKGLTGVGPPSPPGQRPGSPSRSCPD